MMKTGKYELSEAQKLFLAGYIRYPVQNAEVCWQTDTDDYLGEGDEIFVEVTIANEWGKTFIKRYDWEEIQYGTHGYDPAKLFGKALEELCNALDYEEEE